MKFNALLITLVVALAGCAASPSEINLDEKDVDGQNLFARDTKPVPYQTRESKERKLGWH